jgi:DNA-binding response OmpR family regulator
MKILLAADDPVSRRLLETHLEKWGHAPVTATDGTATWDMLQRADAPSLAILDWMMPGLDGVEVCRRARGRTDAGPLYIILLTARADLQDTIDRLGAGADDFVTKPFDAAELRARVSVGVRVVELQIKLARGSPSWSRRSRTWTSFTGSCPSAHTARRCGTTAIPGSRWKRT